MCKIKTGLRALVLVTRPSSLPDQLTILFPLAPPKGLTKSVSTHVVPLSLDIMLLIHGTWSESNSRHQPYSVWDIFEAEYTERILCR